MVATPKVIEVTRLRAEMSDDTVRVHFISTSGPPPSLSQSLVKILIEREANLTKGDMPHELLEPLDESIAFLKAMTNAGYWAKMLIYLLENKLITGASDDRQDGHAVARR